MDRSQWPGRDMVVFLVCSRYPDAVVSSYGSSHSVRACVDPNPRNAVNRKHSGFQGYEAVMFLFGFVWGIVNLGVAWMYYAWLFGSGSSRGRVLTTLNILANVFIVLPFWAVLIIMPFFGGWITVPIAQRVSLLYLS